MATTLTVNASDINIYIGGVKVGAAENGEFTFQRATRDAFSKDSGIWDEKEYGKANWGIGGTSKFRFDESNYGADDMVIAMISGTKVGITFSTEESGDWKLSGTALVTQFKLGGNAMETMTHQYQFDGTGEIAKLTI